MDFTTFRVAPLSFIQTSFSCNQTLIYSIDNQVKMSYCVLTSILWRKYHMFRILCLIILTLIGFIAPSWAMLDPFSENDLDFSSQRILGFFPEDPQNSIQAATALQQTLAALKENPNYHQDFPVYEACLTTIWQATNKYLGGRENEGNIISMRSGGQAIYNALSQLTIQQQETLFNTLSPLYKTQLEKTILLLNPGSVVEDLAQNDHSLFIGTWFKNINSSNPVYLTPNLLSYLMLRLNQIKALRLYVLETLPVGNKYWEERCSALMSAIGHSPTLEEFTICVEEYKAIPYKSLEEFLWSLRANPQSRLKRCVLSYLAIKGPNGSDYTRFIESTLVLINASRPPCSRLKIIIGQE